MKKLEPISGADLAKGLLGKPDVDRLIDNLCNKEGTGRESAILEFKASWKPKPGDDASEDECRWNVVKAIISMANASGGCIVLGLAEDPADKNRLMPGNADPDGILKRPEKEDKDLAEHTKRKLLKGDGTFHADGALVKVMGDDPMERLENQIEIHICKSVEYESTLVVIIVEPIEKNKDLVFVYEKDEGSTQKKKILYYRDALFAKTNLIESDDLEGIAEYFDKRCVKKLEYAELLRGVQPQSPKIWKILFWSALVLFAAVSFLQSVYYVKKYTPIIIDHIKAVEQAQKERDDALAKADQALKEKDKALEEVDAAVKAAEEARSAKGQALKERDEAMAKVLSAEAERDEARQAAAEALTITKEAQSIADEALKERDEALAKVLSAEAERDEALKLAGRARSNAERTLTGNDDAKVPATDDGRDKVKRNVAEVPSKAERKQENRKGNMSGKISQFTDQVRVFLSDRREESSKWEAYCDQIDKTQGSYLKDISNRHAKFDEGLSKSGPRKFDDARVSVSGVMVVIKQPEVVRKLVVLAACDKVKKHKNNDLLKEGIEKLLAVRQFDPKCKAAINGLGVDGQNYEKELKSYFESFQKGISSAQKSGALSGRQWGDVAKLAIAPEPSAFSPRCFSSAEERVARTGEAISRIILNHGSKEIDAMMKNLDQPEKVDVAKLQKKLVPEVEKELGDLVEQVQKDAIDAARKAAKKARKDYEDAGEALRKAALKKPAEK